MIMSARGADRIGHDYRTIDDGGFASSAETAVGELEVVWAVAVRRGKQSGDRLVQRLPHPSAPLAAGEPADDSVLLWLAAVSPGGDVTPQSGTVLDLQYAATIMNADERERLGRFRFAEDRRSFLAAHAGARILLSRLVARAPEDLTFEVSATGKPRLADGSPDIDFSLSHARGVVAVAAARMPVGVDVEPLREIDDLDGLAEIVLADDERKVLRRTPAVARSRHFLRYWTIKEALLKAAGFGFSVAPNTVVVDASASAAILSLPAELGAPNEWQLMAGTNRFTQMR